MLVNPPLDRALANQDMIREIMTNQVVMNTCMYLFVNQRGKVGWDVCARIVSKGYELRQCGNNSTMK